MSPEYDLLEHFNRYFEIVRADTPELREQAYRLRYQVYCHEGCMRGFDPENYPDKMERDSYDQRSAHCLLQHRLSGVYAGTVRLVLGDNERIEAPFPVEEAAGGSFYRDVLPDRAVARGRIGECSRFVLARQFRSRPGEQQWPDGMTEEVGSAPGTGDRRIPTHPTLGLMKACVMMSWERGARYWYAGMEPRLDRRLRQFGLALRPVSPLVDYYGPCRAYYGFIPEVLAGTHAKRPDVWTLLTNGGEIWPLTDTRGFTQRGVVSAKSS